MKIDPLKRSDIEGKTVMANEEPHPAAIPEIRQIEFRDLGLALADGVRDFRRAPVFGLVIAALFVLGGIIVFLQLLAMQATWVILPVSVAFPLIGPFVVVGLYEVSHRLELGEHPDWAAVARRVLAQKDRQIPSMAFVVTFFAGIWFFLAHLVFALTFGLSAITNVSSSFDLLLSREGMIMLGVGSIVGALLAFALFSLTVVSFPLLVDRDFDFVTGMITSVQAVSRNLRVMILWALIVAGLTFLALVPAFLGLFVVLPILGHATWHLYRRILVPV
ncbi:MAG: DUF2189 domain-containing protein [Paracoccaceae bacterium]